jgi:ferredoxin
MSSQQSAPDLKIPVPRGPVPVIPPPRPRNTVELTIDGQPVIVPEGATLLEAARQVGIDTPTLCYLENLTPVNVCRVCVVELEGARTLVPACSRKAEPGMVVKTDSERVRLSRRLVLELLASSPLHGRAGALRTAGPARSSRRARRRASRPSPSAPRRGGGDRDPAGQGG